MDKKIYGSKLVAFGDSVTEGTGIPENSQKWTEIIMKQMNLKLINSGIGGNTSLQGLERIKRDVLDHEPDFVTICFGMNDHCFVSKGKPRISLEHFEKNIKSIVNSIRSIDAIPILITPNYIIEGNEEEYYFSRHNAEFYSDTEGVQAWLDKYIDIIRNISVEENVAIVDIRKECEKFDPYLFLRSTKNDGYADGVHPYVLGAKVYAKTLLDYMKEKYC